MAIATESCNYKQVTSLVAKCLFSHNVVRDGSWGFFCEIPKNGWGKSNIMFKVCAIPTLLIILRRFLK